MRSEAEKTALIEKHLARDPYRQGRANAVVKGRRLHVWALIGHWKGNGCTVEAIAEGYDIPLEVAEAALAFYERYKSLIDDVLDDSDDIA